MIELFQQTSKPDQGVNWSSISQIIGLVAAAAGAAAAAWAASEAKKLRIESRYPEVIVYLERNLESTET